MFLIFIPTVIFVHLFKTVIRFHVYNMPFSNYGVKAIMNKVKKSFLNVVYYVNFKAEVNMTKITEVPKESPFRIFTSVNYEWRKFDSEKMPFEFLLRPLKPSELAIVDELNRTRDNYEHKLFLESVEQLGLKWDDLWEGDKANGKYFEAKAKIEFDDTYKELVLRTSEASLDIVLGCVSMMRCEGEERAFSADICKSPETKQIREWITEQVMFGSKVSEAEKLGL